MKALTLLLVVLFCSSCSAPISYRIIAPRSPAGNYGSLSLAEAFRDFEAGQAARDPQVASRDFIDCARLADDPAIAGDQNAQILYDDAVSRLVEKLEAANSLPWGKTLKVGSGDAGYILSGKLEPGAPTAARRYLPTDTLEFGGKYGVIKAARPGIGAPLVGISSENRDFRAKYGMRRTHAALTAVLRFKEKRNVVLELHDPLDEKSILLEGRSVSLAADFSSPAALLLAIDKPYKLGLVRLLNPQKYSDTARLSRMQNYDKKRIPVLFVHGLQDTPATWAPMYFSLLQDPVLREKYQFWIFSYPSGYPYPYSAALLRKELDGINRVFPDHKKIVIIGHSMGGVISRLMVTDAGDRIWRNTFGKNPGETKILGASRELLLNCYVFNHRSDIGRVVFISAPHRGSGIASSWVGSLGSRLVRVPSLLADARNAIASAGTADMASLQLQRTPNSIDTLSPKNHFVREVNSLPLTPGIPCHSIMGDRGRGGNRDHNEPASSDGVVPYWSSHLDGVASEKIVPSNHSAHQNPRAIEEVHRILLLHLGGKVQKLDCTRRSKVLRGISFATATNRARLHGDSSHHRHPVRLSFFYRGGQRQPT